MLTARILCRRYARRPGRRNGRGRTMGRGGGSSRMGSVGAAGRQAALKGRSRRQQDMYAAQQGYGKSNGRAASGSFDERPSSARHPNSRRPPAAALALGAGGGGGRGGGRPQRAAGRFGRIDQDEAAEALLGMGFAYEVRCGPGRGWGGCAAAHGRGKWPHRRCWAARKKRGGEQASLRVGNACACCVLGRLLRCVKSWTFRIAPLAGGREAALVSE